MKVLLTGGTGFIGKAVLSRLDRKHEISIFGRTKPEPKYEFVKGDLRNLEAVSRATNNIEAIIHLGAVLVDKDPVETMEINTMGTFNLLEAAVKNNVKRFVFASSIQAIGDAVYLPINEDHPCKPKNIYGLSKLMGEELCSFYSRLYNLSTISLRIGGVLDWKDLSKKPGDWPEILWSCVDVRDVTHGIDLSLDVEVTKNEILFITAADQFSAESIPILVKKHFPRVKISKDFLSRERASFFDISKARKVLGYQPKYDYHTYIELQKKGIAHE